MTRVVLIGLTIALAAGTAACRDGLTGPGVSDQGVFFVEIGGHKDTTYRGEAAFYQTFEEGVEVLTLYFVNAGSRFQLSFSIRDFRGEPEIHDVSLDPERYSGSYAYTAAGQRVTYSIEGGTITFDKVSRFVIEGEIDLDGIATEGPNPGGSGTLRGTFVAVCEGDCLGSGEPPPGG